MRYQACIVYFTVNAIIYGTYPKDFRFFRLVFQVVRQGKEVPSLYLIASPSRDALTAATLSLDLFTVPLVRTADVTLTWFASNRTLTQSPVARLDEKRKPSYNLKTNISCSLSKIVEKIIEPTLSVLRTIP